jgi:hypothetical protein
MRKLTKQFTDISLFFAVILTICAHTVGIDGLIFYFFVFCPIVSVCVKKLQTPLYWQFFSFTGRIWFDSQTIISAFFASCR